MGEKGMTDPHCYTGQDFGVPDPLESIEGLIQALTANEGDSVTFMAPDPESFDAKNICIECCGGWTEWIYKRFYGLTFKDCLKSALKEYA